MKRFYLFLGGVDLLLVLACAFRSLAIYLDYTRHPQLYAVYSAPWYTDILVTVILTAVGILITGIIGFSVGWLCKRRSRTKLNSY